MELHSRPIILYVTVGLFPRLPLLANPEAHAVLREAFAQDRKWVTGFYLVMPDHVHFFAAPANWPCPSIRAMVKYWKSVVARQAPSLRGVWQPDCWDTQMRNAAQFQEKLEYVRLNPVRRRLVSRPEDWPYRGILHDLAWLA